MTTMRTLLDGLSPEARTRLLEHSRPVRFTAGTRVFRRDELDVHVPGHRDTAVDPRAGGALRGCSWIVPPHLWHLGATAVTDVRALEFDARAVRELCVSPHAPELLSPTR
ncbi:hypothetical protein HHL19_21570 [Streptomyces sp. R302]|uniref:hypothetical protein n=1 Tax=unclassified Streptomyces TaxID=2593676 RepID=UPI00145CE9FE|nr:MULTISPECIES: hypothetical protein [unclassified Streptomyces]NML51088.1 hypothetical protein [Streptomyces sp. R301]NML81183.1 hypothetical protein [Streptomyces sp. R302]